MKNSVFFLLLAFVSCTTLNNNKNLLSGDLEPGSVIKGILNIEKPDLYTIELDSNTYIYGEVNQVSVDVVVTIKDAQQKIIGTFDGPASGPEHFMATINKRGQYMIEVAPFEKDSGEYTIELKIVEPLAATPEKKVGQLLYQYSNDYTPGAAVGVLKNGKLIFSKAYGMADLTNDIKFKIDAPSNIGSVTKQFTATAILLLEQQGKLSTEDDIRKYISELPEFEQVIKIKNLLNHTNGLWEVYNLMPVTGWKGEDVLLRDEIIKIISKQDKLQALPGEEYNYNNSAFIMLAELVERITGTDFPEWVKENIFTPLGMENSYVRETPTTVIKGATQGYTSGENGFVESGDLYGSYGAGGIYTTVGDLAKWMNNFKTAELGGEDLITKLVTPDTLNSGDTMKYAKGIAIGKYKGLDVYNHGGADIAHRAMITYFPEIKSGVAVLSNNAGLNPEMIAYSIADAFFEEYLKTEDEEKEDEADSGEIKVDEELLKKYAGKYKLEIAGMIIEYKLEDGKFTAYPTGQPKVTLNALNDTTFSYEGVDAKVTFIVNEEGNVEKAIHTQGGDYEMKRLPGYAPGIDGLLEFTGKYINEALETLYTIEVKDSSLVATHINLNDIILTPFEEDKFTGNTYFMVNIEFKRNAHGIVNGFTVSNGRTKNILFVKL